MQKTLDRIIRSMLPSSARLSYNPVFKLFGNPMAALLGAPFPQFRNLPPNHLRVRVGVGNRVLNNQAYHIDVGRRLWFEWLANGYVRANSDITEIGCGCGRIALHLRDSWFTGTYTGIDIDTEMLRYCETHFPSDRFDFRLSPHISAIYRAEEGGPTQPRAFGLGDSESRDFVYSTSLFTHLLEPELHFYMRETFRILRPGGVTYMTFFCRDHVDTGGRWTFRHRAGNAHVENEKYPEAAVAYTSDYIVDLARECGYRDISVLARPDQSVLLARK